MTTVASPPQPRLLELSALLGDLEADAERRAKAHHGGQRLGPATGLASLDKLLGDCLAPGLHIHHGGPGVGKTCLALQIASDCGFPALYVSAEMAPLELLRRLTARLTRTFLGDLKTGALAPATVVAKAREAIAKVPRLAIVDATDAFADPGYLATAAAATQGDAAHVLVVIDSVHAWSSQDPDPDLSEYDRLTAALGALRGLARQLGCPVVGVAERNRMSRDGGLYAAAGTRGFEYSCESMVGLDVDEKATAPTPDHKVVLAKLEKNRHGPGHGKGLRLAFHGGLQTFTDLEPVR